MISLNNPPIYLTTNIEQIKNKKDVNFKINKRFKKYESPIIKNILEECDNGVINRRKVLDYFERDQLLYGFFAAMIWGGISTGGRTGDNLSKLLEVESSKIIFIVERLQKYIHNNLLEEAYKYMAGEGKLKGLGPSYFTKLFFFIGEANKQKMVPLIYDKWTNIGFCALLLQAGENEIVNTYFSSIKQVRLRSKLKSKSYQIYSQIMNQWAHECSVSASDLEQFVFGNDKRKDKSDSNPRVVFEKIISEYIPIHEK